MNRLQKFKRNLFSILSRTRSRIWTWLSRFCTFQNVLIVLFSILLVVSMVVIFFDYTKVCISGFVGLSLKNKILTFLGIGIGGSLIVLLHYFWKSAMSLFSKLWQFLIDNLDRILVGLFILLAIVFVVVMCSDSDKDKILTFLRIVLEGILIFLLLIFLLLIFLLIFLLLIFLLCSLFWKSMMDHLFIKLRQLVQKFKERPLWQFLLEIREIILVGLLIGLAMVFVVVMISENFEWSLKLFGVSEDGKYKVLTFLGIGMGGILVALQALASHRRAKAMEKTVSHTEQGLRQERLKNAIEHLGNKKESVRWGGAYELYHLAEDSKEFSQTALDMLCLQIRQTTSECKYRKVNKSKPSEEVQSLLTLLFVKDHEVFKNCDINLQGSWLNGANLGKARLQRAILSRAHLQKANLIEAQLQGARLEAVCLQDKDTRLDRAHLQGADLGRVHLQDANLTDARLQGADLKLAHLQGALLTRTRLQGADLNGTHLPSPVYFFKTCLQGAGKVRWSSDMSFAERIRSQIDQQTDLSGVVLEDGLDQNKFYEVLKDKEAITGTYTEEEAEQWIAEYEEAMSEVPEDDS